MKKIIRVVEPVGDGLARTDWQDPASIPTIPGSYEAVTGGGHIFKRKYDGKTWYSAVNNEPSTVQMPWRGVVPGSIDLGRYDSVTKTFIHLSPIQE